MRALLTQLCQAMLSSKLQVLWPVLLLAACQPQLPQTVRSGLVYCSEGSPENFAPSINTTGTSFDAARPVYNRLVQFKPGTTEVAPALAESWTVSEDGKTFAAQRADAIFFHADTLEEALELGHDILVMRDGAVSARFDLSYDTPTTRDLLEKMV